MPANFSEFTRVQIPALLHLERLGYTFVPRENLGQDLHSNILSDVFKDAVRNLNPELRDAEIEENARQGQRCFMGLLDPSVRPYVGTNELSFTIPMSRFKSMMETMKKCFLFDSHAWKKVKARLEE